MTDPKLRRLYTLLSAASYTLSEVRHIVREIQASHSDELLNQYVIVRSMIRDLDTNDPSATSSADHLRVKQDVTNFARRTEPSASQAAARLRKRLMKQDELATIPEFNQKQGFSKWLDKALQVVAPSALLNAAIEEFSINRASTESDWTLSG